MTYCNYCTRKEDRGEDGTRTCCDGCGAPYRGSDESALSDVLSLGRTRGSIIEEIGIGAAINIAGARILTRLNKK